MPNLKNVGKREKKQRKREDRGGRKTEEEKVGRKTEEEKVGRRKEEDSFKVYTTNNIYHQVGYDTSLIATNSHLIQGVWVLVKVSSS